MVSADPVSELVAMLSAAANEDGLTVFFHTAEEIGLHVMENHAAILAALRRPARSSQSRKTAHENAR